MARYIEGPKKDISYDYDLGTYFFESADKFSSNIFQIEIETNTEETFGGAKSRAIKTALFLRNEGITCKDIVGICGTNSLDTVIPCLAALYIGVKVTTFDVTLSPGELEHYIKTVTPTIFFVHETCVDIIESTLKKLGIQIKMVVFGKSSKYQIFSDIINTYMKESCFQPTKVDCRETAFILFSSGTTGLAKGVCLSHRGLYYSTISSLVHGHVSVLLEFTSLFWISAIIALVSSHYAGASILLSPKFHPVKLMETIEKYKISQMFLAPILVHWLISVPNLNRFDTSSLFMLSVGGEYCPPPVLMTLRNLFKHSYVQLIYGMTELSGASTLFHTTIREVYECKASSSGTPINNSIFKVVDLDTRKMLPANERGELCVKSPGLFNGYFNMDASNEFDEEGFLKTGDVAYYDEHDYIYIVGRIKDMFKYQSWHVVPLSIELIVKQHPSVKEAVVFGIPHPVDGAHPAALVVLKEDNKISAEELVKFVNEKVSDRQQLRGGLKFVKQLPITRSGKYQRNKIREIFLSMQ